ncbi:MAG: hypothetical protein L0332_28250 [Chloroflexi bacterium]|nr:hypothetical protein [Chloroflexota bacterium]MCI0576381.1 hypothetical protein [Chloroflexota bacterium]MCI0643864.1 hypothetical protein [Chloroflexota bacterium]MCI0730589.1 hypothetical protein [Chloroflexota bacterium]
MKHPYRILFFVLFVVPFILLVGCTPGATTEPAAVSATATAETQPATPAEPASTVAIEPTITATPAPVTAAVGEAIAYMQGPTLYIRIMDSGETIPVETCPDGSYCILQYLKWSPAGRHLLYYYYDGQDSHLRLADRQGRPQTVSDEIAYVQPGAWSPDGRAIAFFRATDTYTEGSNTQPPAQVHEVWTVAVGEDGAVGAPQLAGVANMLAPGCGGAGRSESEVLYENEGGTSYGYLMGVMEWTAPGILLYTTNCANIGIGRFDLNSGTELEPFAVPLRNLVLNTARDRWFAVSGPSWSEEVPDHQIVTGTPDSLEIETLATSQPVELLFYGPVSGRLYYTARQLLEQAEVTDQGLYFAFFESALWTINPDGTGEALLWQSADQAFARLTERPDGAILFTRVENDRPLYEAAQDPAITDLSAYSPQRHIVQIPPAGGEPVVVIENAGQPALSPTTP